jgi:hypothetical protein
MSRAIHPDFLLACGVAANWCGTQSGLLHKRAFVENDAFENFVRTMSREGAARV